MAKEPKARELLATQVNARLAKSGESGRAFARRCGILHQTLARIRNKGASTRLDTLDKLAEGFGVEPATMLTPVKKGKS